MAHEEVPTPFARTNYRNKQVRFGIKTDDRRRHVYIVGKTGTGKTTLIENMVIEDIRAGRGVGLIDPHGDFADRILDFVPAERIDDVVYFNPADIEHPIGFNPLEGVGDEYRHLVASGIMSVFKKIWVDAWSARMEYILNNTLLALLEYPGSTLMGVMRMMGDRRYRDEVVANLRDPVIRGFWVNEFGAYSERYATEAVAAIQNKLGQFIANPLIRNIIGQPKSSINMREIMDGGKIFVANLAKGKIGEDNSALLGAMIVTKMQQAAMSRVDVPEEKRRDFYLYIDEFQNFSTESFAVILSEARKYRLALTLVHQYIEQLDEKVKYAVFGNVGTMIVFRIGAEDAEFIEKEFMPEFVANDLINLDKHKIYVKLMIDGIASRPFSAETLPPVAWQTVESFRELIIEQSRRTYAVPKVMVEQKIVAEWAETGVGDLRQKITRRDEQSLGRVLKQSPQPTKPPPPPSREAQGHEVSDGHADGHSRERKPVVLDELRQALSFVLGGKSEPREEKAPPSEGGESVNGGEESEPKPES